MLAMRLVTSTENRFIAQSGLDDCTPKPLKDKRVTILSHRFETQTQDLKPDDLQLTIFDREAKINRHT